MSRVYEVSSDGKIWARVDGEAFAKKTWRWSRWRDETSWEVVEEPPAPTGCDGTEGPDGKKHRHCLGCYSADKLRAELTLKGEAIKQLERNLEVSGTQAKLQAAEVQRIRALARKAISALEDVG